MPFSNKKKYLILTLILVLVLAFTFRQNIMLMGVNIIKHFNEDLSEEIINNMDSTTVAIENNRLKTIIGSGDFSIYMPVIISQGSSVGGKRIDYDIASKILEKYNDFKISSSKKETAIDYSKNVSLILWFSGRSNEAINLIESIDLSNISKEKSDEINIIKSGFYLSLSQFNKVSDTLEKISTSDYVNLKNLIDISNKNLSDPHNNYVLTNYEISNKPDVHKYFEMLPQYSQSKKYKVGDSGHEISGYITDNGKPMAGVIVYLGIRPGISSSGDFYEYTVSDKNGYYQIKGFDYEKVRLKFQIPWNRIQDKQVSSNYYGDTFLFSKETQSISQNFEFFDAVKIKNLEVENGNLIYEIYDPNGSSDRIYHLTARSANSQNINSMYSSMVISHENLKGSIPIDKLRSSFDISYSNRGYEGDLVLENFLEPLYLEDDYIFNVSISSNEDSNFYVTNGFFSDCLGKKIHVESPYKLSEGDKFLDENEFEKAIQWFKNNESEHGYKILSALYSRGYILDPENEFSFERDGRDLEKALFYKKKIYELDPENEGNALDLIWAYGDLKMYDEEYSLIMKYKKLTPSSFSNFLLAENEINRGNLVEGIKIYLEYASPLKDYDRYFGYLFLADETKNLTKSYLDHFADFNLDTFEQFFNFMKNGKYEEGYKWLTTSSSSNKITNDLVKFYTLLYLDEFKSDDYDDFVKYYVDKTNEIEDSNLKWILKELKYDSNWFN